MRESVREHECARACCNRIWAPEIYAQVSISFFGEHKFKHCIFEGERGDREHLCAREQEEEEVGEGEGIWVKENRDRPHA